MSFSARDILLADDAEKRIEEVENAMDNGALSEWLFEIREALAKDLQPTSWAILRRQGQ